MQNRWRRIERYCFQFKRKICKRRVKKWPNDDVTRRSCKSWASVRDSIGKLWNFQIFLVKLIKFYYTYFWDPFIFIKSFSKMHVVACDPENHDPLQMKYLMNSLVVFQQSLTNMPPTYMARLVFDPRHRSLVLIKEIWKTTILYDIDYIILCTSRFFYVYVF